MLSYFHSSGKNPFTHPSEWLQNLRQGSPPSLEVLVWSLARLWLAEFFLLWSLALRPLGHNWDLASLVDTPTRRPSAFCDLLCCEDVPDPGQPRNSVLTGQRISKPHPQGQGDSHSATLSLSSTSMLAREIKGSYPGPSPWTNTPPHSLTSGPLIIHLPYSASHSWAGKEPFKRVCNFSVELLILILRNG